MNEGCLNCGREEQYNGAENPDIRYLCGVCTMCGVAKSERALEEFALLEREVKANKRSVIRIKRKGQTIQDC